MHPKSVSIADFTYELPESRIALFPLAHRDQSRLLHYQKGAISHHLFSELPLLLPDSTLLVFNNTKVVQARLHFQKTSGTQIEIMCLEPVAPHHIFELAFHVKQECTWKCMVGNAKRWKNETLTKTIQHDQQIIELTATLVERQDDHFLVKFSWTPSHVLFGELLSLAGVLPLPPYLNREATETDVQRYQTVYAREDGSVAAPTAGLHFTPQVLEQLSSAHHTVNYVTLHVGAGTFKPVKSLTMEGHHMHNERFQVNKRVLENLINPLFQKTVAVGTTSLRTLESLYWCGVNLLEGKKTNLQEIRIGQWEPYESVGHYTLQESIDAIIRQMESEQTDSISGETQLLIAPGYQFRVVDGIVTNFHQPGSTLLLLIAAFIGKNWEKVYSEALTKEYRFLSYGDSSLLWRE